jgi:phytol kinase
MKLISTVFIVFGVLMLSETWWRHKKPVGEFSRKLVHMSVGSFVAFWPFFLTWNEIKLLSLAFLIVVLISKNRHLFQSIYSVERHTSGELYFALAVGLIAFVTHDKWIYMAALLLMSLADGLAAIIGERYGKANRYKVFGQTKSVAGTLTFFIVALLILIAYSRYAPGIQFKPQLLGIVLIATAVENLGVIGLDNLLVPLLSASLLSAYH